ncbi:hypothetical protein HY224_01585 [Candidatus Uhrbacteria bacterium]|nr:hypothetical protein [Candidatus Uhrbacteria bacterium]
MSFILIALVVLCVILVMALYFTRKDRDSLRERVGIYQDREQKKLAAEQEAMWQKVRDHRHLLTGQNWRDPAGKRQMIAAVYDGQVPKYLWYAIPRADLDQMTDEEAAAISDLFWPGRGRQFGDWENSVSENSEVGIAMRIRNPEQVAAEVVVAGTPCPLYLVGHHCFGYADAGPIIMFLGMYDEVKAVEA